MNKTRDMAELLALMGESQPKVPAAVTNIREALGVTEVTHPREVAEQAERDADVAEAKFGTADENTLREWWEAGDDSTPHAESYSEWCERLGFETPREVTKLPEVHDHAGDDLPFHIPAGKATQVLGSREIDPSRVPDQLNPLVTDSNGRALAPRSALAREREAIKVMREHEALKKLMRKWGVKRFSYSFSR
jgi:hypothetical protein